MAAKRRPEETSFSSEGEEEIEEEEEEEESAEESEIEDGLNIDVEDDSSSNEDSDAEQESGQEDLESLLTSDTSEEEEEEIEINHGGEAKPAEYFIPGADGRPRLIKPEIDPVYDSDDSDLQEDNTIGNIPLSAYDSYPHIGYNINGKRILRPATGSALDQLLDSIEIPEGWTGLLDKNTGESLKLTPEELDLIRKVDQGKLGDSDYNPYEDAVDWFTQDVSVTPLSAAPEPKRRFIPSKNESKRVMKIVRAIREGRIVPNKEKNPSDEEEEEEGRLENLVDIWADNAGDKPDHVMHLPAPKLPPPSNDESYNPPEEYLLTEDEKKQWQGLDPSDREKNFIPQKFSSLRAVPGYSESVRERFERSLDLYLAPRVRKNKLNIDPESLVPKLPSPKDLRPFPTKCSIIYTGHQGRVRSTCIDPSGVWMASGGDDHHVRIWEVSTGRQVWSLDISKTTDDEPVDSVEWNPVKGNLILAVASGRYILLLVPPIGDAVLEEASHDQISSGWSLNDNKEQNGAGTKIAAEWHQSKKEKIDAIISVPKRVKQISWHRRGDYFLSTSPEGASSAIIIHQLSKHKSQAPFRKSKGIVQSAHFHPFKSIIFVATQRYIRVYDLSNQIMIKKLLPGVRWLSNFDIHPRGDQIVASSYDRKVVWIDMELSNNPYKTLRYHDKAVRDVAIHKGNLPLFCSASDDGNINIFHVTVYDDLMMNPLLVPLKILKGHKISSNLGVLCVVWHPSQPWLFSAGADGTIRLWTN